MLVTGCKYSNVYNISSTTVMTSFTRHTPASMTTLLGDTADVSRYPFGLKAALSSLTNAANAGLSESGPFLQSTYNKTGLYILM